LKFVSDSATVKFAFWKVMWGTKVVKDYTDATFEIKPPDDAGVVDKAAS
jgi:hypothetical protein